jgi:hypothetical protein
VSQRYFTNAKVHAFFDAVLRKVVTPMHKANPIERIEVEVLGDVTALDKDP